MAKSRFGLIILTIVLISWSLVKLQDSPEIKNLEFGSITINGILYTKDVVIEKGVIRERKKGPSKYLREKYGHTPLTPSENIPWNCDTLVIGIGMSSRLPVIDQFKIMASDKGVILIILETPKAVEYFIENYGLRTNAIFHITC